MVCETRSQAEAAMVSGKVVVSDDAFMLLQLPVDIVVESTGAPEAAAVHADAALRNGKHVAMVSKEPIPSSARCFTAEQRLPVSYTPR